MRAVLLATAVALAGALALVPLAGPAAAKKKRPGAAKPKITRVMPMRVEVGAVLRIRGRNFHPRPRRNTVVFRGSGGRTAFVKPRRATRRKLVLRVSAGVARLLLVRDGAQRPTRMRLRVLSGRFSRFTPRRLSPVVLGIGRDRPGGKPTPDKPLAACNSDADHDDDLLPNQLELQIGTDPCLLDTDGDGIEDGYEYKSAKDLNDDELQDPNTAVPYPGKRPYPNPLDPGDAETDFDGDSLTLRQEQRLWRHGVAAGRAARTLTPLYYSDGEQYSVYRLDGAGRRQPNLPAAGYPLHQAFLAWAAGAGYRNPSLVDHDQPWWDPASTRASYGLLDVNRDGAESAAILPGYRVTETTYYDHLPDGYLSDDERDEDADGLTNYDETRGRMNPTYWSGCYSGERPYAVPYAGTDLVDPDSDGDGIRDGADDQDHDDIPNLMELSRNAASGLWDAERECKPLEGLPSPPDTLHPAAYGRVNPFNPCLPAELSRTCLLHPDLQGDSAPYDNSLDWPALN